MKELKVILPLSCKKGAKSNKVVIIVFSIFKNSFYLLDFFFFLHGVVPISLLQPK